MSSAELPPPGRPVSRSNASRTSAARPQRRRQPASGARLLALATSLLATGGVAIGLAYTEGAFLDDEGAQALPQSDTRANADETSTSGATEVPATTQAATETAVTTQTPVTAPSESAEVGDVESEVLQDSVTSTSDAGGTYLGTAEYTEWGDVQVEVTLIGGEIVDVVAVQIPSGRKSTFINDQAEPLLEAQAIEIQAADLDIVSGATYTSITYADSLQAALDQAALAEARSLATDTP